MEPSASSLYFSRNHTAHLHIGASHSCFNPFCLGSLQPHSRFHWFVGYWYVVPQITLGSRPLTLLPARIDVQVRMGLCCHHGPGDGCVYVVHGSHHFKEVNTVFAQWFIYLILDINLRIQYRRAVNQADNKAATVSIDSLINYEAVKVCHLPPPPHVLA